MTTNAKFDQQFSQRGHAEVLVILRPTKRVRRGGASALDVSATKDLQNAAAESLMGHFERFDNARATLMAAECAAALRGHAVTFLGSQTT